MKGKYTIVFLLVASVCFKVSSQVEKDYNVLIMGVPQYLFVNGIRVDVEKNIKGTKRWLVFSPQVYNAERDAVSNLFSGNFDYLKIKGAGLGVSYKYLFDFANNSQGVYLSAGGSYKYFDLQSEGLLWQPESTGSAVLEQKFGTVDSKINQFGINSVIGIQSKFTDDFFVDFFIGFGIKLSMDESENNGITDLSSFPGDYGYSGTHLVIGLRFGLGY